MYYFGYRLNAAYGELRMCSSSSFGALHNIPAYLCRNVVDFALCGFGSSVQKSRAMCVSLKRWTCVTLSLSSPLVPHAFLSFTHPLPSVPVCYACLLR